MKKKLYQDQNEGNRSKQFQYFLFHADSADLGRLILI